MAREARRPRQPANRRSVAAPLSGKPKSQAGGDRPAPRGRLGGVRGFAGEVRSELAKVDFPDRHQTFQSTMVVIGACLLVGLFLYALDQVFAVFVRELVDLQNR
jgi:preprotein translocase SecE subunit